MLGALVGLVGGSLFGSGMKAIGANKAGKTAAQGFAMGGQQAEDALNMGYNDAMRYLSPYAQFGEQTLPYLQQYLTQQPASYNDFFKSQQYADLSRQAEDVALRNASATGGLRGGASQVALASIAPQLAMQWQQNEQNQRQQQFGNLFNMAQFGAGFGQNLAQAGMNRGNALADFRYNAATGGAGARAQGQQGMFNAFGQMGKDVGSIFSAQDLGQFDAMRRANQGQTPQPINMQTYQAPAYFTKRFGG